jgi:membrane dipeptidase
MRILWKAFIAMIRIPLAVLTATLLLAACADEQSDTTASVVPAATQPTIDDAKRIAREYIIVDTHIDLPDRLATKPEDVSVATAGGNFDYPRAVAGGLNAPFMAIYTSAETADKGESYAAANRLIDGVEELAASHPDKFAIALSPADVRAQFRAGLISLPLGMENGSPLDGKLENVAYFYGRGIRYITLAHGKSNLLSDSSYDENRQWDGLSDFGVAVVREMNRLGMMVDVSHLSDAAFYDVLEVSGTPVIATHSSSRHFTPGFERNMSDDMIRALAEHGGLIMINFGSMFLTAEANAYSKRRNDAEKAYKSANPGVAESALDEEFAKPFAAEHGPYPHAATEHVLDHFDHVVALVGVEHVGIGSDFDGVEDTLPVGLKDVSGYPNLVLGLLERGYSEADIAAILGENLLRVWSEIEAARTTGTAAMPSKDQATTSSST